MKEAISSLIREIRNDNRSGASEIAEKAGKCLTSFAEAFAGGTREVFLRDLLEVGRETIEAQPAMAPLFNLVNRILLDTEKTETIEEGKLRIKEMVGEFIRATTEGWRAIAVHADVVVREGSTVLVHSYSSTLYRTLLALHGRMRAFSVICTESRPLLEGVVLARRLSKKGIRVCLIVDAAAVQLLRQVDLVLVGADTISPDGVINKIGTRGLAMAAQCQEVPFYVLAGTEKCLPRDVQVGLEKEMRPAGEILEGDESIKVLNFYFDRTPLQLVSGVITETGVMDAGELKAYLKNLKIHPVLMDWQEKSQ